MRIVTFDIETETIPKLVSNINIIFCVAIKVNDEETKCYTYKPISNSDGSLDQVLDILNSADLLVGHNICKFDIPVIEKLLGKLKPKIVDTLIDTKIMYPKDILEKIDYSIADYPKKLIASYSLKAFGYRLGLNKIDYEDFTELNEDMVTYCKRDVDVTYKLYKALIRDKNYPSAKIRELEYKVASIIYDQQEYGFYFDIDSASSLATKLRFKQMNLEHKLQEIFPPKFEPDGNPTTPSKPMNRKVIVRVYPKHYNITDYFQPLQIDKKGYWKFPKKSVKWLDYPYRVIISRVEGEAQKIKLTKFNPGSRQQIASRLMSTYGWKPSIYTDKGNIKIDEAVLTGDIDDEEL